MDMYTHVATFLSETDGQTPRLLGVFWNQVVFKHNFVVRHSGDAGDCYSLLFYLCLIRSVSLQLGLPFTADYLRSADKGRNIHWKQRRLWGFHIRGRCWYDLLRRGISGETPRSRRGRGLRCRRCSGRLGMSLD